MKRYFQTKDTMGAARKKTTGRKKSQSGNAGPRGGDPEAQHDEAMRILRAEYYSGVRGIAEELQERVKSKDITSQDDWETAIHQAVDGSYWVIYTHANFQVLMCSDHHDAYSEEYGQPPVEGDSINWAALAFAALDRDVRTLIDSSASFSQPNWDNLNEAPRIRIGRTLSIEQIDVRVTAAGVSKMKFWQEAMGGDRAPLPIGDVDRIIADLGGSPRRQASRARSTLRGTRRR